MVMTFDHAHCSNDTRIRFMAEAWNKGSAYLLICYDDFSNEYYPAYIPFDQDPAISRRNIEKTDMQRVEAVIMVAEDGSDKPTPIKDRGLTPG